MHPKSHSRQQQFRRQIIRCSQNPIIIPHIRSTHRLRCSIRCLHILRRNLGRRSSGIDRRHCRIGHFNIPIIGCVRLMTWLGHIGRWGKYETSALQFQQTAAGNLLRRDWRWEHNGSNIKVFVDGHFIVGHWAHFEDSFEGRFSFALFRCTAADVHNVDLLGETSAGRWSIVVRAVMFDATDDAAFAFHAAAK